MTDQTQTDRPAPPGPPGTGGELPRQYRPADHERRVRDRWDQARAFHADPGRVLRGEAEAYCVLIPPPNVTAALHLGHALNNTIQDVLVRAHRMRGFETLWMPGTDHAGIATQSVVERRLIETEGTRKTDLAREAFVEKVHAHSAEFEARITEQLKRLGCSCDYERQRFTMDDVCARAVREAFFQLFRAGLIYRGKRLVNWDPVLQTAVADDEVESVEIDGIFAYMRYPLVHPPANPDDPMDAQEVTWSELAFRGYPGAEAMPEDENAWITVATTRPETYLGDTGVAMNPDDPRRVALDGLMVQLPIVGRVIPIVIDSYVVLPPELGGDENDPKSAMATGFLKVTPAHDPNDWEIGLRHGLEPINVMAPDASISDEHGWSRGAHNEGGHVFLGKSREEARKLVLREFEARNLLEKVVPHRHAVGHSDRSKVPIEPYLSDQWYVRVTDDRLRGNAQRALSPDQRTPESLEAWPASRPHSSSSASTPARGTGVSPVATDPTASKDPAGSDTAVRDALQTHQRNLPHWQRGGSTYFLTFRLAAGELSEDERRIALEACFHWHEDRAVVRLASVMPDHVHLILTPLRKSDEGWWPVQDLMHSIKSYSAHEILKARGTSGPLWQDEYYDRLIRDETEYEETFRYVQQNPVAAGLAEQPADYPFTRRGDSATREEGGSHGRDARATRSGSPDRSNTRDEFGDGTMRFHPARYARTYETWHDHLRDWCISRQLWWGHRIPVWAKTGYLDDETFERVAKGSPEDSVNALTPGINFEFHSKKHWLSMQSRFDHDNKGLTTILCVAPGHEDYERELEHNGFVQDPDVLDTWFSSALWPLSTMGWPDPDAARSSTGIADFPQLLDAFNPTSVLSTGRDIITLWVSRMVMFNRYFRGNGQGAMGNGQGAMDNGQGAMGNGQGAMDNGQGAMGNGQGAMDNGEEEGNGRAHEPGPVPFRDVFVHAMIQDGEGRKMSKSLGNGVDPLDIIESHGTDAMRFTLCHMTTQTQDVRLPVRTDPGTGKNTSPKFDLGRNFCNKLWNASRFALGILEGAEPVAFEPDRLGLADRWMLSRLRAGVIQANSALERYEFGHYAVALYDLLWRDFCDWYLEAVKPTGRDNPSQQAVLRSALDAILRLLHPACPFITEAIHERLRDVRTADVPGLELGSAHESGLLCRAMWPSALDELADFQAERGFERMQALVGAIREVRAQHDVSPKRAITLHLPDELEKELDRDGALDLVATLAGVSAFKRPAPDPGEINLVEFTFETSTLAASDLAEEVDQAAERARLERLIDDLRASIASLEKRLSNPGYAEKAPAHLVAQTRDELEAKRGELNAALDALERHR